MKTLKMKLAAPPVLDTFRLERLATIIDERMKAIEAGRRDRVKRVQEIRKEHMDDFSHRAKAGSIYQLSNIGVPLVKGVATSYASKVEDELLANDQPFIAKAQDVDDKEAADQFTKYWLWEIMEQMNFRQSGSETLWVTCTEGTAIKKRSWAVERSYFTRIETQLHGPDGPVMGQDGQPVQEGHPEVILKASPLTMGLGRDRRYLKFLDPEGVEMMGPEITPNHEYVDVPIKDSITHYDNAKSELIPFEDFWCDMTVSEIKKSPVVAHVFDQKLHEIMEKVMQSMDGDLSEEAFKNSRWVLENLQKLKGLPDATSKTENEGDKANKSAPKTYLGESASSIMGVDTQDQLFKTLQFAECYLKYDIDGDGIVEEIIVLMERSTKLIVWYELLVNVYADCKLPFEVHGFFQNPGRWWSYGPYDYLKMAQDFVDKVFNRVNYRSSMSANPLAWVKQGNFIKPPPRDIKPGDQTLLKESANAADSFGYYVMPQMEAFEWQIFQFFVSLIQLITGISNAAQGDVSSLPSTATATGTKSIIEEGNKLYRMFIRRCQGSFEREISGNVRLIQQNVEQVRVFRYNKGLHEVVARVNPEDIRELDFDVKIVLSKYGQQQRAQAIQGALQIVQTWIGTPPEYQVRLRDLFIQLLNSIGIIEADSILPSMEELQANQNQDALLAEVAGKIQAAAQQIQGGGMDKTPEKSVVNELMMLVGTIQEIIQQAPAQQQPQPEPPPQEMAA